MPAQADDGVDDGEGPPRMPRNNLSGRQPGWMGKMRIHKSGRVTFKLGDSIFDVSEAAQVNFLQQVMSSRRARRRGEKEEARKAVLCAACAVV